MAITDYIRRNPEDRPRARRPTYTFADFRNSCEQHIRDHGEHATEMVLEQEQFDELRRDLPPHTTPEFTTNPQEFRLEGVLVSFIPTEDIARFRATREQEGRNIRAQEALRGRPMVMDDIIQDPLNEDIYRWAQVRTETRAQAEAQAEAPWLDPNWIQPAPPIEEPMEAIPERATDEEHAMYSPEWLRENIDWSINLFDYDRYTSITGEITVRHSIRCPTEEVNEREDHMKNILIDWFSRRLTSTEVGNYEIDDKLRNYLFWLHQNVSDDTRLEADIKFDELKEMIWPATQTQLESVDESD